MEKIGQYEYTFYFFFIICSFCSYICFIQIVVLDGRNVLVFSKRKYNKNMSLYIFHSSENIWLGPQETFGMKSWFLWEIKTFFNPPAQNKWKYVFKSIANWSEINLLTCFRYLLRSSLSIAIHLLKERFCGFSFCSTYLLILGQIKV